MCHTSRDVSLKPVENSNFYNLYFKKRIGARIYKHLLNNFIEARGYELIAPLQYDDHSIRSFSAPSVYLLRRDGRLYKIRLCNSQEEAKRIANNLEYAACQKLPVSRVIQLFGPLILLEYISGQPLQRLSKKDIASIADIHSKLNHIIYCDIERIEKKLKILFYSCFQALSHFKIMGEYKEIFLNGFPKELIPVFDHQDFNLTNVIRGPNSFFLVDEEALGILPFGYSLYKAMQDARRFNICSNREDVRNYLSRFPQKCRDYYLDTEHFWKSIYILRESARVIETGNLSLAKKMVEYGIS